MNFFVAFSSIRLKGEVSFFIREFSEVFYFPSDFIAVAENFQKEFLEVPVLSKSLKSLGIEPIIGLYIFYGWQ